MAVYRGPVLLGYLEAKDVGISLDAEERSPQLKRYREALPNLTAVSLSKFVMHMFPSKLLEKRRGA
jgi:hypothetical protein